MKTTPTIIALFLVFTLFALPSFALGLNVDSFSPTNNSSLSLNISKSQTFIVALNDTANVNYQWFVNGSLSQSNTNPSFSFTPSVLGDFVIVMNATQSTTNNSVNHTWIATVVDPNAGLGLTGPAQVLLGSDDQRASNDDADDEELRDVYVDRSVTLTNNNPIDLENMTAVITPLNGFNQLPDLNVTVTFPNDDIAAAGKQSISIRSRVPDRLDAVNVTDLDIRETSINVALVTVTGTLANGSLSTVELPINIQRKNNLILKDLDVCVETDCQDVGSDSTVDNIKPGDTVEFRVEVENLFSTNKGEDLDIDDVEIAYEIDDNEFNEDDEEDIGSISARGEDDHIFEVEVPDDVDSGLYKVTLRITGTDENGALHGVQEEFTLDVERKSHDIALNSIALNPSIQDCSRSDRSVTATIISQNIGRDNEDEGVITLTNSQLNLDKKVGPFYIDEDNKRTDTIVFTLPDDARSGTYDIVAKSFFDTDKQTDEEGTSMVIAECSGEDESSSSTEDESDDSETQSTTQRTPTARTPSTSSASQRTFSTPTTNPDTTSRDSGASPLMVFLLVFVIASIIGIIILLVLRLR